MNNKGVTLVELIVVISIISILALALGFSYFGWQGAYKVEKSTKDLFTDLMDARSRALTRSREYFVDFPTATAYRVIEDTNGSGTLNNGDTIIIPPPPTILPLTNQKVVEYDITTDAGGVLTFTRRGIINALSLTEDNPEIAICFSSTADPDYDCIELSQTRINMGRLDTKIADGGDCDAVNCVTR